jgi:predicted lipoprotein with Yx(FWY)xxD motif
LRTGAAGPGRKSCPLEGVITLIGNKHRPPRGSLKRLARTRLARTAAAVAATAALAAGSLGTLSAGAATHPARTHAAAHPARTGTARVVKIRHRPHIGRMLVTAGAGKALYILPHGSCTADCLTVWPRLVLPRGTTMPAGASCLGTKPFGSHHRLQVTYHGKRLYTFVQDMGMAVTGDGLEGFRAARVVHCGSPMTTSHRVTMVHPANRMGFGKILTAARPGVRGRALYVLPSGTCTGGCVSVWPRLVLPRGKTIPAGASCLGTKPFGSHHRLQVTYHGKRVYMFDSDSGTSVNGDGVAGFAVAKVITCH